MSYMALYRKWRPDEFQEVRGQEHIVTTLKNQIKHERIGHAYLFCGTRGTGKTTIAKLMAKAVNCEHPVDGSPCNECESCKAIASGSSMNVIEIDAASNNGVDNVRQINNAVRYSPSSGKYLVYIIDEVHMLSIGAFNALLKTLEEPPEYVIFILATTEAHKIPTTIMSRCQRYDFRRISIETITDRLVELVERENVVATRDALAYVAKAADGSMRDALSILDQCIAFNLGEELTYDRVLETIGAVDIEVYIHLFESIIAQKVSDAIDIIDKSVWQGKDLTQLLNEFVAFIRNVLMLKLDPGMGIDLTSDNIARLVELGTDISEDKLIRYINILQEASNKINYVTTKRIVLEVAIIKMCKPQMEKDYSALIERIEQLESELDKMENNPNVLYVQNAESLNGSAEQSTKEPSINDEDNSDRIVDNLRKKYKEADFKEIMTIVSVWDHMVKDTLRITQKYLELVKVTPGDVPSTIDLVIEKSKANFLVLDYFDNKANIEDLEAKIAELTGRDVHIGVRKITSQEMQDSDVSDFDLSKINYKIDYKY